MRRSHDYLGANAAAFHSLMECSVPQSRHFVRAKRIAQGGQTPPVWKMSNACPHFAQVQNSPSGGAVLHAGQANPSRRGSFAKRNSARACCSPPQQFISMKTAMAPYQMDCSQMARMMKPATPIKQRMEAPHSMAPRPT